MIWSTQPPPEQRTASDARFSDHARAFLASAIGYLRARMELAGLESREAAAVYGKIAALVAAAIGLLLFGYIFLWIGVIAVIALLAGIHWGWITLCVGVLHLCGTAFCLWRAKAGWGEPVFTETIKEFRKDQEWLSNSPNPAERRN